MNNIFRIAALMFVLASVGFAETDAKPQAPTQTTNDISGLYSFVHEGEFVQIEVNDGKITGLISRFKDEDPDKAEFVDQFFEQAKLAGSKLTFRTKQVDGAWFEFSGKVERGPAKTPTDEGYWIIKGTLTERRNTPEGKMTAKDHELTLKSFPEDTEPATTRDKEKPGTEPKPLDSKE